MLTVVNEGERFVITPRKIRKLTTLFSELIAPQINCLVSAHGRTVIMNLEGIEFIDSSGLSMLARATDIARAKNAKFELVNMHAEVKSVIDKIGLTSRLVFSDYPLSA